MSVIVPVLNEAGVLEATLGAVAAAFPEGAIEVIVADGGSHDASVALAGRHACQVVSAPRGRGPQMNAGAALARGDVLLFLHADTLLPPDALHHMSMALESPRVVGGGFRLSIAGGEGSSARGGLGQGALRMVARGANLRTRLTGVFYGDQGLFVRREVFVRLGGFPPYPIMEDVAFGRRLKRAGQVVLLPVAVTTSARRWEREGLVYTTLRNWLLVSLFLLGVSPTVLVRGYRPHPSPGEGG
ncbi:MAG: TIGR04283 family arsenosugar biosynthesis glycosyltransferase [Nitrospirota bacterium]|nr:TIGR04283 family arsenosugar biosynthesis glycosyltransferase [Nitrospirota bacterium]